MDLQQAFDEGFDALKGYVDRSFGVFAKQIEALEQRISNTPLPKDGKDGEAGKSVTIEDIEPLIKAEVDRASQDIIAALPVPVAGKDADPDLIKRIVDEAVAALPPAERGKDADPAEVAALVTQEAERILAGWERPANGKDGAPGEKGADGKDGRDGTNGVDVMDVVIDREGNAVFTMSDGRMKNVGLIVGKDGEAGLNGKDGAPGTDGKNGLDGVGFDDMDLVIDEEGVMIKFVKGENVKSFRIPVPIDRGVFKEGAKYRKGDGVSFGGSWFIAQEDTSEKPESGKGWRLAVKRGRDGKSGEKRPVKTVKVD